MAVFLFETEVEERLNHLENLVIQGDFSLFQKEMPDFLCELSGLAQMLDIISLISLCQFLLCAWEEMSFPLEIMANSTLHHLRRSQSLVLTKQKDLIPSSVTFEENLPPVVKEKDLEIIPSNNNSSSDTKDILNNVDTQKDLNHNLLTRLPENNQNLPNLTNKNYNHEQETIRISLKNIQDLVNLSGELTLDKNSLNLQLKNVRESLINLQEKIKKLNNNNLNLRNLYDQTSVIYGQNLHSNNLAEKLSDKIFNEENFDVLEMDNYNELHLLTGEIMENIIQIEEISNDLDIHLSELEKSEKNLNRTNKFIQNSVNKISMRPLNDLLQKFPRILRQMEIQYEKQVNLEIKGGNTLLEKKVLETLNDPLLHLFRNAFDHGIEDIKTREIQGKNLQGLISITANYRGNQTIITIKDDGRGINLDKIKEKAISMGIKPEQLANITEKELLNFIFQPGFTTNSNVTDLSGRGIGMDVVKRNIEAIGGEIDIETELGIGTTFIIHVPFNLSILRVLLVECQNMLLAFPSYLVQEVKILDTTKVITEDGKDFVVVNEKMMPLIRISDGFDFNYLNPRVNMDTTPLINQSLVLIVKKNQDINGLQVDRFWGEKEVSIRQVEGNLSLPVGFSGCTILGDGKVVPLVDTIELLNYIENKNLGGKRENLLLEKLTVNNKVKIDKKINIMVVDDSINVRRFLALILEKENYEVEQAKDGQEALEKLQSGLKIDGIISDIEMPRMDGYGLLARVKNDPILQKIPMIMLTSRSAEKHRKIAFNLGANSYFSKPFAEEKLLETITNLINN
jgi:chemosensory pili system protein ChpA (sensor histidine kinase/response regulator)